MACLHPTLRGLLVSLSPPGRFPRPPGGLTANAGAFAPPAAAAGQGIRPPCATGDLLTCSGRQLLAQQSPSSAAARSPEGPGPGLLCPRRQCSPGRRLPLGSRSPGRGPAAAGLLSSGKSPSRRCGRRLATSESWWRGKGYERAPARRPRAAPPVCAPYLAERRAGLPPHPRPRLLGRGTPSPAQPGPARGRQPAELSGRRCGGSSLPCPALPGHPPSGAASPRPPRRAGRGAGGQEGAAPLPSLLPSLPPFFPPSARQRSQEPAAQRQAPASAPAQPPLRPLSPARPPGSPAWPSRKLPVSLFPSPRRSAGAAKASPVSGLGWEGAR